MTADDKRIYGSPIVWCSRADRSKIVLPQERRADLQALCNKFPTYRTLKAL